MPHAWVNMAGLALDLVGVWLVYFYAIPNMGDPYVAPEISRRHVWLGHAGLGCLTLGFLLQGIASGLALIAAG